MMSWKIILTIKKPRTEIKPHQHRMPNLGSPFPAERVARPGLSSSVNPGQGSSCPGSPVTPGEADPSSQAF